MKKYIGISVIFMASILFLVGCSTNKVSETSKHSKGTQSTTLSKKIKGKDVNYYVMNPDPVMGSTAVLIEKNGNGLLIDTQFSTKDAKNILKVAKDNKISIKQIYISYSDPDFYFGTDTIKKQFPSVKVNATGETIKRIKDTYESKLSVWKDTLKDGTPKKIVIPDIVTNELNFEGEHFNIFGKDSKKQTVYSEKDKLLLGGILVSTDSHLFMSDTKTIDSQKQWVDNLTELQTLKPKTVIPSHFGKGNDFSDKNISFTKKYIETFTKVQQESKTSKEVIEKMKKAYPKLDDGSLEMSAKVVTGEQPWE